MQTVMWTADAGCRLAVKKYVEALAEAGIPVALRENCGAEIVCEWGMGGPVCEKQDSWDELCSGEGPMPDPDEGIGRMADHYGKTLELLATDPELARAWLAETR